MKEICNEILHHEPILNVRAISSGGKVREAAKQLRRKLVSLERKKGKKENKGVEERKRRIERKGRIERWNRERRLDESEDKD